MKVRTLSAGTLILASCSYAQLTRPLAKTMINDRFKNTTYTEIDFVVRGYEEYIAQGGDHNDVFARAIRAGSATHTELRLLAPAVILVEEVTGIADVPLTQAMKEVQFRWTYHGIPDALKPMLVTDGTGKALFRRYDNGWRVDNVSIKKSYDPPVLSAEQRAEVRRFKEAELTRRAGETARREEKGRQLEASRIPTKVIYKATVGFKNSQDLILTDANITILPHQSVQGDDLQRVAAAGAVSLGCFIDSKTGQFAERSIRLDPATDATGSPSGHLFSQSMSRVGHCAYYDQGFLIANMQEGLALAEALKEAVNAWVARYGDVLKEP